MGRCPYLAEKALVGTASALPSSSRYSAMASDVRSGCDAVLPSCESEREREVRAAA